MTDEEIRELFSGRDFSPFLKKMQREMAEDIYTRMRSKIPVDSPLLLFARPWQELSQQEQDDFIHQFSWIS